MGNRFRALISLLALWALTLTAGLAHAGPRLNAGPYRVEITSEPPVIPMGRATLRFQVVDPSGKPVTGAHVTALAQMPGMPMGEREEEATPEPGKPGSYAAPAAFGMAGAYDVTVKVSGPAGNGTGKAGVSTGENTAGAAGGFSFWPLLFWLLLLAMLAAIVVSVARAWRGGWRPNVRAAFRPQVLISLALLALMALLSTFAIGHWRRKGAMTPMEAQAANMEQMPAPVGQVAVTLVTVTRGPVAASVRYTGTAVGYVEQDIYPRTQGWITWMPFYPGDRVHRGQLLAKLDTTELQQRVAERQATERMAEHQADIARQGYQQSLASAAQARAEIGSKQGMLQDAREQKRRAEAGVKQARNEVVQSRNEVAEAREQVAEAQAERAEAQADLAAAQTMAPDAEAQLAAAKSDQTYLGAELQRSVRLQAQGVIALAELQKDRAAAQNAASKVSQAQARIRQVQEQIRAAQSKAQKADASERAANARIAQMAAKFDASQAKVEQAQADIASAAARIDQAQAEVEAAKANARAMQSANGIAQHQIEHSEAGVSEARAAVTTQRTIAGYTEIRSLVDGVITQRNISPGVLVAPGQSILKVAQIHPIRIQANVPEADLARIQRGARVRIVPAADAGGMSRELVSAVSAIFPAVDPGARQGIVEALLPNGDNRFLPGQFVTMEVTTAERAETLRIPSTAVLWRTEPSRVPAIAGDGQSGKQPAYVWIAEPAAQGGASIYTCPMHPEVRSEKPGVCPKCKMDLVATTSSGKWRARRADVTVGVSDGRVTEVLSGLKADDRIVASGYQNLHDGDALLPANEPEVAGGPTASPAAGGEPAPAPPPAPGAGGPAPSTAGGTPSAAPVAGGRYYCPMHPEVISSDPNATCPKCGMKLMPRPGAGK